jgi:hypothetical protein
MMSKQMQKLLALSATVGAVAMAAAAGAMMPKTMIAWAIIVGTCIVWIAGLVIGRIFGSAPGWSLWALGTALGAAVATTGLIPRDGTMFVGAALLVSIAAVLVAKSVSDAVDSCRDQH